jgi:iron complex outermembrane receptor protein
MKVDFTRVSITPPLRKERNYNPVVSPRIALLKKLSQYTSVYASFSKGYSAPTIQELYPSTAEFDEDLNPEQGTNYEIGFHGNFLQRTISVEAAAYAFNMDETIAIRRNEDGAEYFVNSGKTLQQGIETKIEWSPGFSEQSFVKAFRLWTALTINDYRFKDFLFVTSNGDSVNLDKKSLTGVPSRVYTSGADVRLKFGLYLNTTLNYTGGIVLNDEHTFTSDSYTLLGSRLGYKATLGNMELDVFTGIDNVFDETYSLGNDLNAVGSRFFNVAPGRNYFGGFKATWILKNQ